VVRVKSFGELSSLLSSFASFASFAVCLSNLSKLMTQTTSQLEKLNCQQLDDFAVRMLNWQQPKEMEEWLLQFV
jgi:hypothetical protein